MGLLDSRASMRKILSYKLKYYELMLSELGDLVDVVAEADDVATQERLMISPELYRRMLKPLHRELIKGIRESTKKHIFIHFHSCGAIRELIPDLIDVGVDALNPVARISHFGEVGLIPNTYCLTVLPKR